MVFVSVSMVRFTLMENEELYIHVLSDDAINICEEIY